MTQEELEKFKKSLEKKSLKSLQKMEQDVVAEADKVDKEVAEKTFPLAEEGYATVAPAIRKFIEKKEVQWQYALALKNIVDFWTDEKPESVPFPVLDSTLRLLGELQYKGYEEWSAIIEVNNYFNAITNDYQATLSAAYDVASRHNAIMEAIQKATPITTTSEDTK